MAVHTARGAKKRATIAPEPQISELPAEDVSNEPPPEPVYLSEVALELPPRAAAEEPRPRPFVPPSTPNSEFHFELTFQPIPRTDRNLTDLQIPIVRDKGLKQCIEEMSEFFHCADYKFNFLQFWFLDVLTDCIWRAQDLFEYPSEQQKIIMAWMIFVIDLIGDPKQNYSQQEFFDIFKEIIITAAECLEEGSGEILLPLKLVQLPTDIEDEKSKVASSPSTQSSPSTRTTTATSTQSQAQAESTLDERDSMEYESVLEFEVGAETLRVVLDHEKCNCSEFGESLPSSVERLLEEQTVCCDSSKLKFSSENENEEEIDDNWDYRDFYKPDKKIPSRFLPLTPSQELQELLNKEEIEIALKDIGPTSKLTFLPIPRSGTRSGRSSDKLTDYVIFRKEPWQKSNEVTCYEEQSEIALTDDNKDETVPESKEESENTQHERIMKGLRNFKLMEQRVRDFSDSKVGLDEWQMDTQDSVNNASKTDTPHTETGEGEKAKCFADEELEKLIDQETMKNLDEQEFLSFGVLWAIIDFVYEYFSDSFQYTLIKMALTIQPNIIIQNLNEEWRTPKGLIEDLTLYVKDLKDKYKMIQRKKDKKKDKKKKDKKKKDKKKTDKKSGKSSKKKGKSDKKSKKSGKSKKGKKEKKPPLTEEELLALKLLEEQEAERLRQEMNKNFLFPLQDAINDEFFMSKFPNWVKVELTKGKGKKGKKDKKDKKDKKKKK